jgi:alpha-beta hydrolase superfamily lysophospholipase
MKTKTIRKSVGVVAGTLAVSLVSVVAGSTPSGAVEIGPAPTATSVSGVGPLATASTTVARSSVSGFGGGVIYYPTSTAQVYGGIAIAPGFTESWSQMSWMGPRLASHGFVVFGIDTSSKYDQPSSRGDQLRSALKYLTTTSSARTRVDASRLGVAGHSMGGGGSLEAAKDQPSLKAIVPLAPYNSDKTWNDVSVPTLIIGGQSDTIAPNASHSIPFYNSLASPKKEYVELAGASHLFPLSTNATVSRYMVSWFKRFIDGDTRYTQFLCAGKPSTASDFRATCPL